ncbi:MAG: hypothetical protein AAGF93_21800 [Cyanobacteria bacterium P01_H01_bin.105]
MSNWFFTARQRFTPSQTRDWHSYLQFSGFTHVIEVVTLDSILCPDLIDEIIDADWFHNVQADYRLTWFTNLAYLRQRITWRTGQHQLLAILEHPYQVHEVPPTFKFCGFDILDDHDGNSVLTNCGQFSGIFRPSDVNPLGLLSDLDQANTIAAQIRVNFPDEPHCRNCRVWQVARDTGL